MSKFKRKVSNKGQTIVSENREGKVKKPFDKAKWREQKYSNKAKINRFEERRKQIVLREYYKELKKSGITQHSTPGSSCTANKDGNIRQRNLKPHEMARMEAERLKQEKENKRLERQRILEERKNALTKYKNTKKERFSKLSRKTQRGQPVMAGRMELLLEKIQKGM